MAHGRIPFVFVAVAGLGLAWQAGVRAEDGAGEPPQEARSGVVFTTTNEAAGNRLVFYHRGAHGQLSMMGSVPTGGMGTGSGLGNQGAIAFGGPGDGRLYAVNAGSDTISVFARTHAGPVLVGQVASGGDQPISVAVHQRTLYVLNAGALDNIVAFRIFPPLGVPVQVAGSTRPLSAPDAGPAQVGFSNDGRVLVVTEKNTNLITTFVVNSMGVAGQPHPQPSAGMTPFGFAFNRFGHLIVSEAFGGAPDGSAVSSYRVERDGDLVVLDASEPTTETAACWIANTANGRFSYTTNTGSNTVSGYRINRQTGDLTLVTPGGATAPTGAGGAPTDAAVIGNRLLYVLNSMSGEVVGYSIGADGGLVEITRVGSLPANSTGLLAR